MFSILSKLFEISCIKIFNSELKLQNFLISQTENSILTKSKFLVSLILKKFENYFSLSFKYIKIILKIFHNFFKNHQKCQNFKLLKWVSQIISLENEKIPNSKNSWKFVNKHNSPKSTEMQMRLIENRVHTFSRLRETWNINKIECIFGIYTFVNELYIWMIYTYFR